MVVTGIHPGSTSKMTLTALVWLGLLAIVQAHGGSDQYKCLEALECCLHPFGSPEFHQCCSHHTCCPSYCTEAFSNASCCYNKNRHPLGSVVERLPQCCTNLTCGARLTDTPPFLATTIVAVNTPPSPGQDCGTPSLLHCIKDNGVIIAEGSEWLEKTCEVCLCRVGVISCRHVKPVCPSAPQPHCREVPGHCCPTWNCTKPTGICVDSAGVSHEVGEEWWDPLDSCVLVKCTEHRMVRILRDCPAPLPQPHQHCNLVTEKGQCCPTWRCKSGCIDNFGHHHDLGHVWPDPADPCLVFTCTSTGIERSRVPCPPLTPPPHADCTLEKTNCCFNWTCKSGCVDYVGRHHDLGQVWPDPADPCFVFTCTSTGIERSRVSCPPLTQAPRPDCKLEERDCCFNWTCKSACVDNFGHHHDLGHVWPDPADPCFVFTCTSTGIERSRVPCPTLTPPPHADCTLEKTNCCFNWTCKSGCVDYVGRHHDLGKVWPDPADPCFVFTCTSTGIERSRVSCPPLTQAPRPDCKLEERDCCFNWTCKSGCVDYVGRHHKLGHVWPNPADSCLVFTCTSTGIETSRVSCPPLAPSPLPDCELEEKDCCFNWTCKFCLDASGHSRSLDEEWTEPGNLCLIHHCNEFGISDIIVDCPLPPPPPGPDCFWVHENCCGMWQCNDAGCVDEDGGRRSVDEKWKSAKDSCITFHCTNIGIVKLPTKCPPILSPPHLNCSLVLTNCCFTWHCPQETGCLDEHGVHHALGEVWTDPQDSSRHQLCEESGIQSFTMDCTLPPPRPSPDCNLTTHQGGCCPTWECPTAQECPNPNSLTHMCEVLQRPCYTHTDCSQDMLCCLITGCGRKCVPGDKPGRCPRSQISLPLCDFPVNSCERDQDCPQSLKCCWDCGFKCKTPLP